MAAINEEGFLLLHQYNELLETVEEAFLYLSDDTKETSAAVSRQIVLDSYEAIGKIAEAHVQLVFLFEENMEALQSISDFSSLIDELEQVGHFDQKEGPEKEVLTTYFRPAFESWKMEMQKPVLSYIAH
jgi:hypothetical protein